MTKSTKSQQREHSHLFANSLRAHELVARAMRGECVRHGAKVKSVVLPLSAISYYHACEHITRESRADSCTHCLHARYKCRAGVDGVSALTRWIYIFYFVCGCTWALACVAQFIDTRNHSPVDIFFTTRRIISVDFFAAECAYSS